MRSRGDGAAWKKPRHRLDTDLLGWFRNEVDKAGGGNYQSLINLTLRDFVNRTHGPLENMLRGA